MRAEVTDAIFVLADGNVSVSLSLGYPSLPDALESLAYSTDARKHLAVQPLRPPQLRWRFLLPDPSIQYISCDCS